MTDEEPSARRKARTASAEQVSGHRQALLVGPEAEDTGRFVEALAAAFCTGRAVAPPAGLDDEPSMVVELDGHHAPARSGAAVFELHRPDGGLALPTRA